MEINSSKLRVWQDYVAKVLGCSNSTLQQYRYDINMLSPNRIPPKSQKRRQKISNTNLDDHFYHKNDLKKPQSASNELKSPQKIGFTKPVSNADSTVNHATNKKIRLKGVGIIETNGEYLDETLPNNNAQVELVMQVMSKGKTVRNNTVKGLKDFDSQSSATQAKKGEQIVSIMPAIKRHSI